MKSEDYLNQASDPKILSVLAIVGTFEELEGCNVVRGSTPLTPSLFFERASCAESLELSVGVDHMQRTVHQKYLNWP